MVASCQDVPNCVLSQVAEDEQPGEHEENKVPEEKAPEEEAPKQDLPENKEAARKGSCSMEAATLPEELEVASKAKWGAEAAKNGQAFFWFSGTTSPGAQTKSSGRANGSLQRKKVPQPFGCGLGPGGRREFSWRRKRKSMLKEKLPNNARKPQPKKILALHQATPEELHIAENTRSVRRGTKSQEERWVFKYKGAWGPNKTRKLSSFYIAKANAARPFWYGGADWRNRVETKEVEKSLPVVGVLEGSSFGQTSPIQCCSEGLRNWNCEVVAQHN